MAKTSSKKSVKNSTASSGKSSVKRIHNPITNSYYQLRVRNTSEGNRGTIIGKWSPPKK